jgi:hypothetical protein
VTIISFSQNKKNDFQYKTILKDDLLSVKQMRKDLLYWYKTILNVHPNPYQVLTPEQLDIKVQELLQNIDKPLSKVDFFLKIGLLNSYFDYHTQIEGYEIIWQIYRTFFPPHIINMKDGDFCFENNPHIDTSLWNAKINSINHISCEELIDMAKSYVSFEEHYSLSFNAVTFFMQHLLHGIQDTIVFEYEKNNKQGTVKYNIDDCIKLWELTNHSVNYNKYEYPFNYKIFKDDSIAILELNSFLEERIDPQQYSYFLNHFFDTINSLNIKHLFIDISANSGGSDNFGYEVFEYLIKDSIYYLGKLIFKTSKERKALLRKYDKDLYHEYLKKSKNKRFFSDNFFWNKKTPEEVDLYKNNVYLIQSRQTASAASNMVSFVKTYKVGITIGTEISDGNAFYGNILYFKMKHSELYFTCASSYWTTIETDNKLIGERIQADVVYPISNPSDSFLLEPLRQMLYLIDEYKNQEILK